MYGIFTYIWLICMVNVGKYTWILWVNVRILFFLATRFGMDWVGPYLWCAVSFISKRWSSTSPIWIFSENGEQRSLIDAWQWFATLDFSEMLWRKTISFSLHIDCHSSQSLNNHPNHLLADFLSRRLRFADKDETVGSEAITSGGYAWERHGNRSPAPLTGPIHLSGTGPRKMVGTKHR